MRSLLNHGRDSIYLCIDDDDNVSKDKLKEIIAKRFSFVSIGHSFRITEMEAALGVAQLEDWKRMIQKRREHALYLTEKMRDLTQYTIPPSIREGNTHSFMIFPLVLREGKNEKLVNYLEQHGIETREMMPLINKPIYKKLFHIKEEDFPVAAWINESGFYIGCHQGLLQEDLDHIITVFFSFFKEKRQ
jgi:dTDP-4-amino-4,6-dideoxygalactose transaminase